MKHTKRLLGILAILIAFSTTLAVCDFSYANELGMDKLFKKESEYTEEEKVYVDKMYAAFRELGPIIHAVVDTCAEVTTKNLRVSMQLPLQQPQPYYYAKNLIVLTPYAFYDEFSLIVYTLKAVTHDKKSDEVLLPCIARTLTKVLEEMEEEARLEGSKEV